MAQGFLIKQRESVRRSCGTASQAGSRRGKECLLFIDRGFLTLCLRIFY